MRTYVVTVQQKIRLPFRDVDSVVNRDYTVMASSKKGAVKCIHNAGIKGFIIDIQVGSTPREKNKNPIPHNFYSHCIDDLQPLIENPTGYRTEIIENRAYLSSDFGLALALRKFNMTEDELATHVGRYLRGVRKGKLKGLLIWSKVIRGGWYSTGPAYEPGERTQGYVVYPNQTFGYYVVDAWTRNFIFGNKDERPRPLGQYDNPKLSALDESKIEIVRASFIEPCKYALDKLTRMFPNLVSGRIKTLDSIVEKLQRKGKPIEKMTDIAGARVTFRSLDTLYKGLLLIEKEFNIVEKQDYIKKPLLDYRGINLLAIVLGKPVEIQLHTTRTEDWSIVGHDTLYKNIDLLGNRYGLNFVAKLQDYSSNISKYYEGIDDKLPYKKPDMPLEWMLAGQQSFKFNPIIPGRCYELAGKYVVGHPKATLVHGQVSLKGPSHGHAWIEFEDIVYDVTVEKTFPKSWYYATGNIHDTYKYSEKEAIKWMLKSRHYGPWEGKDKIGKIKGLKNPKLSALDMIRPHNRCLYDGRVLSLINKYRVGLKRLSLIYRCPKCNRYYGRILTED